MPIKQAAYKSVRKDKKRHLKNLRVSSELKTLNKRFESLMSAKKLKEASAVVQTLISHISKAASKGIIPKNRASRKISRLMKRLKKS